MGKYYLALNVYRLLRCQLVRQTVDIGSEEGAIFVDVDQRLVPSHGPDISLALDLVGYGTMPHTEYLIASRIRYCKS